MKKLILLLCLINSLCIYAQSGYYYYDKRFKKTDNPLKAKYFARIPATNKSVKLLNYGGDETLFAEGIIVPADTLLFEGKVIFYKSNNRISNVQFYKNGQLEPLIFVDYNFKRVDGTSIYSMILVENNIFYVFKTEQGVDGTPQKSLYAVGKVKDKESLLLDSLVTFYNTKGDISDIKKYADGQEIPFISSTVGYDKPHDIMGIVSHEARDYINIDYEMRAFILQCRTTGADGVIGVRVSLSSIPSTEYSSAKSSLIIQGTTIKLK